MLDGIFERVLGRAYLVFPWIKNVRLRYCADADSDHKKSWRQFAHTGCQDGAVCFARAAQDDLSADEMTGMVAHELGHVVGDTLRFPEHAKAKRSGGKTPQAVQDEADRIAKEFFGIDIRYNKRTLQEARLI